MENVKKQLLQACINHGSMNMDTLQQILPALCEAYNVEEPDNPTEIKKLINEIDKSIKEFDQTLQIYKHPLNSQEYIVYGLTVANPACKFQPQYTDTERNYFYKLLETMVALEDYCIEWTDIYSIANRLPQNAQHPLSKQRVQDLEQLWYSQGYFLEQDDKVYFGPRTIIEYGTYLKNHFPEYIKGCVLCSKTVYWDIKCSECDVKIHRDCIRKYLSKKSTCPSCKKTWNTRLSLSQPLQ